MSNDIYKINKNIDRPIVFKGLKGQYIAYYIVVLLFTFGLFAILNSSGLNTFITLLVTVVVGFLGITGVTSISDKFGKDGLEKYMAKGKIPKHIRIESRQYFTKLKRKKDHE